MPEQENAQPQEAPSIINDDGSFVEGWYEKYDESYHPTLSRFKGFDDLVNSDMSARRKLGKEPERLVEIPSDDADETARAEFYRKLGVPEDKTAYEFKKSQEFPEDMTIEDKRIEKFREIAQKYHLNKEQFNGVANDYLLGLMEEHKDSEMITQQQRQQEYENAQNTLKKSLGKDHEARIARANIILNKYASAEMTDEKGNVTGTVGEKLFEMYPSLKNSPWLTMIIDSIAGDMSEDRIKGITHVSTPTPAALDAKIEELRSHPAYYDRSNIQKHKEVMKQVNELYKQKETA